MPPKDILIKTKFYFPLIMTKKAIGNAVNGIEILEK